MTGEGTNRSNVDPEAEGGNADIGGSATNRMRLSRTSGSAFELLGAMSHFHHNIERYRWYIHSISSVRFLCVLNMTYTLVGVTFMLLAYFPPQNLAFQQMLFLRLGVCILFFSPLALGADLLALRGLRQYKRVLLLPWLIFYAVILALAFAVFITEIYHRGIRWHLLLLGFISMMMFTRWRHINLQFKLMSIYPERPTEQAITDLAQEVRSAVSAVGNPASSYKDLPPPPKYEDLEQPPNYEDLELEKKSSMEAELRNLQAVLETLQGQDKVDCQEKISDLKNKLQAVE